MIYEFSSEKLKLKFHNSKMTYRQLGLISGIPHMTIHRLFSSGDTPCIKHLMMLCSALQVSPRSLFTSKK